MTTQDYARRAEDARLRKMEAPPETKTEPVSQQDQEELGTLLNGGKKAEKTTVTTKKAFSQPRTENAMMEDTEYKKLKTAYDAGVSPKEYVGFKRTTSGISADQDSNGKTVSGSRKKKILQAIDGMNLTRDQKTALYYAAGYKDSTLEEAPWYWDVMPKVSGGAGKGKLTNVAR